MIISIEETFALLNKWKEESALLFVNAESPFREMRGLEDSGVRWTMTQPVRVSKIETEKGFVEFEGPAGNLSLSLKRCRALVYEDYRHSTPDTLSVLLIFFSFDEAFLLRELPLQK